MASILGSFQAAQASANKANLARYKEGIGLYDQMITNWSTGGGFVKGAEATLGRAKKRDMASGMQSLVSSGLSNTTTSAGLGKKWEEEVGAPARLNIADVAGQRLMQAQMGKAGFIERRTDSGPDPGMVMNAMRGMGQSEGSQQPSDPYAPGGYLRDPWKKSPGHYIKEQAARDAQAAKAAAYRTAAEANQRNRKYAPGSQGGRASGGGISSWQNRPMN